MQGPPPSRAAQCTPGAVVPAPLRLRGPAHAHNHPGAIHFISSPTLLSRPTPLLHRKGARRRASRSRAAARGRQDPSHAPGLAEVSRYFVSRSGDLCVIFSFFFFALSVLKLRAWNLCGAAGSDGKGAGLPGRVRSGAGPRGGGGAEAWGGGGKRRRLLLLNGT